MESCRLKFGERGDLHTLHGFIQQRAFTIRIPAAEYQDLRKIAFDKNLKINQIIIGLIKDYIINK